MACEELIASCELPATTFFLTPNHCERISARRGRGGLGAEAALLDGHRDDDRAACRSGT